MQVAVVDDVQDGKREERALQVQLCESPVDVQLPWFPQPTVMQVASLHTGTVYAPSLEQLEDACPSMLNPSLQENCAVLPGNGEVSPVTEPLGSVGMWQVTAADTSWVSLECRLGWAGKRR